MSDESCLREVQTEKTLAIISDAIHSAASSWESHRSCNIQTTGDIIRIQQNIMRRTSLKQVKVKEANEHFLHALTQAQTQMTFVQSLVHEHLSGNNENVGSDEMFVLNELQRTQEFFFLAIAKWEELKYLLERRHFRYKDATPKCTQWISEIVPSMTDEGFIRHCRMDRRCFSVMLFILEKEASHVFKKKYGPELHPLLLQFYVAMQCIGFYGNAAGTKMITDHSGVSSGFVNTARKRICLALYEMRGKVIMWSEQEERKLLCDYARKKFGLPNCFFYSRWNNTPSGRRAWSRRQSVVL